MIIKEFLPNPIGADKDGEYTIIFNDSDKVVNLVGWKISDASKKTYSLNGSIKAKEELVLFSSQTKISLNNNGETIYLYDSTGSIVDKLSYIGSVEEGRVISAQKVVISQPELNNGEILNKNEFPPVSGSILTALTLALILALAAVYVILQLERELDIKLF